MLISSSRPINGVAAARKIWQDKREGIDYSNPRIARTEGSAQDAAGPKPSQDKTVGYFEYLNESKTLRQAGSPRG